MIFRGVAPLLAFSVATPLLAFQAPKPAAPTAGPNGRALYNQKCALCHGREGKARPQYAQKGTPDLADADWQQMRSDADVKKAILEGSEGTDMEAYKGRLTDAQIDAIIRHIRTFKSSAAVK